MKQGREDVEDGKGKSDKHGKNRKKSGGTGYEKNKEEKGRKGDGRRPRSTGETDTSEEEGDFVHSAMRKSCSVRCK